MQKINMTRPYNPKIPITNMELIKKINLMKKNPTIDDLEDFVFEFEKAQFIVPIQSSQIDELNEIAALGVFMMAKNDQSFVPIYTSIYEYNKFAAMQKKCSPLIFDYDELNSLFFASPTLGGFIIDSSGRCYILPNEFLKMADELITANREDNLLDNMIKEIVLNN